MTYMMIHNNITENIQEEIVQNITVDTQGINMYPHKI